MSTNPPIKSLKDFVLGASDQLERKVIDMLEPAYKPGEKNNFTDTIRNLCAGHGKTPFPRTDGLHLCCAERTQEWAALRCVGR